MAGEERLTEADKNADSPFNLYRNRGLTPTPINTPGEDSLRAALNPSTEPDANAWLYYVLADKDGHHVTDLTPQRRVTRTARVRETKEVKPGLFFPVKIERLSRENDGRDRTISTTTISEVRMNDKLPDSTFTLRYADGLPMRDEIRGVTYKVNSRGECISEPKPFPLDPSDIR